MIERVLIIEDSTDISKWMTKLCGRLIGGVTDQAFDNLQAKKFLANNFYKFIFCDLCIPGGDPVQTLIEASQLNACVLIVSALDEVHLVEARTKLLDVGHRRVEYAQKPICLEKLKALL